jgi:NAD(P)-dependent dehydrogenase (short-subunit alcohol dehydrogenase family)
VIVTGGTGALGRAVVRRLLAGGTRVAVSYRRSEEWRSLEAEAGAGAALFGFEADLSDAERAAAFVEQAAARLGLVDGAALIAGGWAGGTSFDEAPADEWSRMLRINLDSAAHVCRAALPHLRRQGGSIVAVGSRAAESGGSGMAAYAVAKVGLHTLVRVLAQENRAHGVRVNAVLPGTIDTQANRDAMKDADRSSWTPPDAIAQVVLFLLSSEAAATTGALVPVDAPGRALTDARRAG